MFGKEIFFLKEICSLRSRSIFDEKNFFTMRVSKKILSELLFGFFVLEHTITQFFAITLHEDIFRLITHRLSKNFVSKIINSASKVIAFSFHHFFCVKVGFKNLMCDELNIFLHSGYSSLRLTSATDFFIKLAAYNSEKILLLTSLTNSS